MDQTLIGQKLESLRRCVQRLESRCPASAELLAADVDAQDILALNLTRAVQLCVDLALHLIARDGQLKPPATMGESFLMLAQHGVITAELAERMRKSVGFRNLAVHNYEEINWSIVFAICQRHLNDFRAFAQVVAARG